MLTLYEFGFLDSSWCDFRRTSRKELEHTLALTWAEMNRKDLSHTRKHAKKWRTRKKIMRRIIKEWRKADAKAKKELWNGIRRACRL